MGKLHGGFYPQKDSVTEPPPGRPSGAAACIACGGGEGKQPPQNIPGSSIYPR